MIILSAKYIAVTSGVVSLAFLLLSYYAMVNQSKRGTFYLTSSVAVNKMNDLSDVFMNTASYDLMGSYPVVQDMTFGYVHNSSNTNLLQELMDVSGCSIPLVRPWDTPMNRTPHCACITMVYMGFLNRTSGSYSNVSLNDREESKDQLKKCLMYRPIWNTSHCGAICELHPLELTYYCHVVIILCCVNYLFSLSQETLCMVGARKVVLLIVTAFFVCLLSFLSPVRTIFSVVSIVVVMLLLIFGFEDENPIVYPAALPHKTVVLPDQYQPVNPNEPPASVPEFPAAYNPNYQDPGSYGDPNQNPGGYNGDPNQNPGGYNGDSNQNPGGYNGDPNQNPGGYNGDPSQNPGEYTPGPSQEQPGYADNGFGASYANRYYVYAYPYRPVAPVQMYFGRRMWYLGGEGEGQEDQNPLLPGVVPEVPPAMAQGSSPHPLTLALWTNLKILLPVYCVYIAVHGFGRDFVNVICFGVTGMLIGISLQNHLWEEWFFNGTGFYVWCKKVVCILISLACMINLVLHSVAYWDVDSPYISPVAMAVVIWMVMLYLVSLEFFFPLVNFDNSMVSWKDLSVFVLVVSLNIVLTLVSVINVWNN